MIKDLSQKQSTSPLGSLLLPTGSESMTDAKLLGLYIKSADMFRVLNQEFNLTAYYKSEEIDFLHRLSDTILLPTYLFNMQNVLTEYNKDLSIIYDESSATVSIGFAHADAKIAQKIVKKIILESSKVLNRFENENTEVILKFLKSQEKQKHQLFIASLGELLSYQNKNKTIDPKVDIEVKNKILAGLESELIQKNVSYNSKAQYLNSNTAEMKLLKGNIEYIKKSIQKIKAEITGKRGQKELNANMSDFTLLKSRVEFNKELYIQTLVKLEETKVLISQNTKNLIVVTKAQVADSFSYPNKIKDSFSILIILSFLYGIMNLILTIIRDHKD
jgi:capsular polysaccharide transport system permease protein